MSFLKTLYSKVTGTGGSDENGDNKEPINKNKKPEFNNTSSKSSKPPNNARGRGRGSTHNTKSAPAINPNKTRNAENKSEIHQEAEKSFQQIAIAHSKINKKFFTISNNKTTKREVYLELIEELDQLVFSLDKAEVTNNQELKDERRSLLLSIQALSKQAKQKIQINNKKNEKVAVKNEEVDPFEDFFKFGNDTYQNWVGNLPNTQELNQNTNGEIFSIETVPQQTGYMIENSLVEETSTDNNSSIELGTKVAVESKDNVLEEITVLNEASNVEELRHENVGTLAMTEDTGILQHENGTAAVAKEEILVNQGEPDVQQVQSDIITPTDNSEESMDFEIIQSGLQEYQESVRDLPTSDNQMCLFQDDVMAMEQHGQACYQITLSETRESKPVPIQLLIQNSEGMFELDEAAVKRVLCGDDVKNRKIAIVSVVGAFRRGKSFLLNFMLRYLNAKGHPDWLTESDEVGGFSWRGGKERETTGILMWPQAFLVGHKLALILLDTQGTFDKHTSMKENTFIFALSTLLSSVQIYNLQDRIQMDDLNNLQYFLEFGRMVETACNTKVFDNLIFLIRDWKHEDENAFGFEGGHQELQEWFNMDHDSLTKQQAEMINTCFKSVECFLMPNPGEIVATSPNFRGSLKDIRPNFLEYLKLFVESVLHRDKLAEKQIGGQFVVAENFLAYMKTYVEKLQHPDLEPKTLFQSMSETCHEKAISKAKQTYMSKMESGLMDATVDIQDLHQTAMHSACEDFDSTPKFGSNFNTTSYKKKLKEHLDELYSRYAREFERHKVSQFHAACTDIYETYQTTLITFCMQLHHECTLEEKGKEACQHAVDTFDNLKFKVPQELLNIKGEDLKKKMLQFYTQQVPYFEARQEFVQTSKTKELVSEVKHEVVKCYQQLMDVYCGGPDPVPDLVAVHARAEIRALNLLSAQIEERQLAEYHMQLQLEVNQEFEEIYKRYLAHDKRKIEKEKEDKFHSVMIQCHYVAIDTYRSIMDEQCGGLKTVENIDQLHKEAYKKALAQFSPHFKVYGNICQTFLNTAKEAIQPLFTAYHDFNKEKLGRNTRERAVQLGDAAYRKYEEQMESLHVGTNPIENLQDKHDDFVSDCVSVLEPVENSENYAQVLQKFNERVGSRLLHYTQINKDRLSQVKKDYRKTKFDEGIKYYQDKMDALKIDVQPVEDLSDKHIGFMKEAKEILIEFKDMENYDSLIDDYEQEIEKKWLVYQEKAEKVREIFLNEEKRTVLQSYNNMKTEYTTNMQRQMSAAIDTKDSSLLYQEHRKQREACLANFQELTRECSEESKMDLLDKLQEDIQNSYDEIEETYAKNLRDLRVKEEELREGASKTYAIGIDLGTTNCCAAVYKDGNVEIITNSIDKTTTPSVVCFKDNETVFGETAVRAGVAYPANCIAEMKRIIGRKYDDPVVQARMKKWQFKVTKSEGMPAVKIQDGSSYKPEEISALVLGEIKRIAEVYLGSKVHDAVVTIPAYFNELQREATKTACAKAGLNVLRMLNEPTAAAIAYGLQCKSEDPRTVLVFDFGGGTCDISIMSIQGKTFNVKASVGDNVLGGEDFDDSLTDHSIKILEEKHKIKINNSGRRRLRIACETAKRKLSNVSAYVMEVDEFEYNGTDKIDVKINIKKDKFEELTEDLVERALTPVKDCLREAKMEPRDIDKVVLVGGSSKMPRIQELLKEFFQREQLDMRINPDEAIAYGAAIQAAVSCGELSGYKILDITPFSLGIEIKGEIFSIIIPKNSKVPVSETERYRTTVDNQKTIGITVYQGECIADVKQNTMLGEYCITNIKIAPAGETKVDVTFTIDADGILHTETVEVGNTENKESLTLEKSVL